MKVKSQSEQILKHLKNHKNGITAFDAFNRYGITRLSGRIFDLRKEGHEIETVIETQKNKYGHIAQYARYRLVGGNK